MTETASAASVVRIEHDFKEAERIVEASVRRSRRERIATELMAAHIASPAKLVTYEGVEEKRTPQLFARVAVEYADALIAEIDKG